MERVIFDYSKLRGRIVEKKTTQSKLSEALGISEQAFSKKMCNTIRFSPSDIVMLCKILDIPSSEIGAYFFTPAV